MIRFIQKYICGLWKLGELVAWEMRLKEETEKMLKLRDQLVKSQDPRFPTVIKKEG